MTGPAKAPFVAPVRLVNMLWLPIVLALVWAEHRYGTPHLRVEYTWSGTKAYPTYHDCRYWGLHSFRLNPPAGPCPAILFARASKER